MSAPRADEPTSFAASATALNAIDEAARAAQMPTLESEAEDEAASEQALAALLLLRELRELRDQLAGWETGLIEAARAAGASWADLAHPLGVASRQAAERRYLRVRPGATGEQRVQATRNHRAADRTINTWARDNAADLRRLAGQITALPDLPDTATTRLAAALADNDAANLIAPLTDAHEHLTADHPGLAARIDTVSRRTDRLRQDSDDQRTAL
ncbi:type III effector protein [Streptomyces sp. NBC_00887]|uniref:type III effector protein n=1 Tax=Streptomyces sp. NBC_00887 TaxID=2975859 RepID=UPI00386AFA79|nr:type III effector protein [Streptomyces sp. NBC_00887]